MQSRISRTLGKPKTKEMVRNQCMNINGSWDFCFENEAWRKRESFFTLKQWIMNARYISTNSL